MKIDNIKVYGLKNAIRVSGYPMQTELSKELGEKDYKRAAKLAGVKQGSGHDCFLKGITAQADITAPQYWWMQFQRYHFSDIISSQSKMHKLIKMNLKKQCNQYVDDDIVEILNCYITEYETIHRTQFKTTNQYHQYKKQLFQEIVSNCPMGLQLTAGVTMNYLQLKSIYNQRKNHKLEEWSVFCEMIRCLPFSNFITGKVGRGVFKISDYVQIGCSFGRD